MSCSLTYVSLVNSAQYELKSYTKVKGMVVSVPAGDSVKIYYDLDTSATIYDVNEVDMYPVIYLDNTTGNTSTPYVIPMDRYVKRFQYSSILGFDNLVNVLFDFSDVLV